MPSEKLARILHSKSPFSEQEIAQMTDAEGWRWVYGHNPPPKEKKFEICFTGFNNSEKACLFQLANDAGFAAVTSVTKNLGMLCTGPYPGPTKLEKAGQKNVPVVNLEQFKHFLATGEIPIGLS